MLHDSIYQVVDGKLYIDKAKASTEHLPLSVGWGGISIVVDGYSEAGEWGECILRVRINNEPLYDNEMTDGPAEMVFTAEKMEGLGWRLAEVSDYLIP